MSTRKVQALEHECEICHHIWLEQTLRPKTCIQCKNPYWDQPEAAHVYNLVPSMVEGSTIIIPWAMPLSGNTQLHPIEKIIRRLEAQGKKFDVKFLADGAHVTRISEI